MTAEHATQKGKEEKEKEKGVKRSCDEGEEAVKRVKA